MKNAQITVKEILKYISNKASKIEDIEVVWLYGSQAKGCAHGQSDIDIAIAFKQFNLTDLDKKLRPQEYALVWGGQLDLPDNKLSIIDINNVPVYLAFNVVEYGNVIYSNNKVRELKENQRIYSQFEFESIKHNVKM